MRALMAGSAGNVPILLGAAWLVLLIALWSKVIWGGWAERLVESKKASDISWLWLRAFSVPQTHFQRVRFIKRVSFLGILLAGLGLVGLGFIGHVAGL